MKKKILSLLLAVLMICALLPFGAMAADQPVYADLIMGVTSPDDFGMLKDLNGDGLPELFIVWDNGDTPFGQIFTIENGKAKKLIELAYDGPTIRETSDYADMEIVSNGDKGLVVTIVETNYDAGESGVFWNEGTVTFYQLTNGALKETDVMRYKLLMIDGTDNFYPERSTITRNGRTISGDEMNAVFESIAQRALPYYPMEQVYNAATGFFQDVPRGEYYTEPVGWALRKGITNGTSSVDFSPMADCTRGQVVTFLWRAAGGPKPTSTRNPFSDVKPSDYYYNAVLWAVEKGITNGTSPTTFSPNSPCTRGQVVTFLWRYAGMPKTSGSNPFSDVKTGEYYYDAVLWASGKNVTNGTSPTTFSPNNTCTRGQIVTFLYRAIAE